MTGRAVHGGSPHSTTLAPWGLQLVPDEKGQEKFYLWDLSLKAKLEELGVTGNRNRHMYVGKWNFKLVTPCARSLFVIFCVWPLQLLL